MVIRIEDLDLPAVHPRMAFITGALDKEIRLSFAQRIRGTLPDPYQELVTEGKEKDTPDFKYMSDSMFIMPHILPFILFPLAALLSPGWSHRHDQ